jgi:hypothetical protein
MGGYTKGILLHRRITDGVQRHSEESRSGYDFERRVFTNASSGVCVHREEGFGLFVVSVSLWIEASAEAEVGVEVEVEVEVEARGMVNESILQCHHQLLSSL